MANPYNFEHDIEGWVYRRSSPKLHRAARIKIRPEGMLAQVEDGTSLELGWRGMSLTRESETGMIYCIPADKSVRVFSDDPNFLHAIETAGGNDLTDVISRMKGERVSTPLRHRLGCLITLGFAVLAIWATPRMFRGAVDATVEALPYEVDEAIGEQVYESLDMGTEVTDETVRAAIQNMIDRLAPHAELEGVEFRFKVIDSETVNAFALPGGYMAVFTGLIKEADGPQEVAGVIAHEMAHVTRRHGLRRIAHQVGLIGGVSILLGDLDSLSRIALDLFTLAGVNSYSQEQETEADLEGARMLVAAQIDPAGLARFFDKLSNLHGDVPDALSWTSTHPQHDERIAAIESYALEAGAGVEWLPLEIDWEAVQASLDD